MTQSHANFRLGHASNHAKVALTKRDACAFYKTPAASEVVDVTTGDLKIEWDTSCLKIEEPTVDILLYAYGTDVNKPLAQTFTDVSYAAGSATLKFKSSWMHNASMATFQVSILPHGQPAYMQTLPAAPIWTAKYAPANGAGASVGTENAGETTYMGVGAIKKVAPGGIAAAVLLPLIALAALATYFWLRFTRQKGKENRKRYSEAIDRRMSTISKDWASITPSGANAAIRHSMAFSGVVGGVGVGAAGNRESAFSFGNEDNNRAGVGAHTTFPDEMAEIEKPAAVSHLRPGLRSSAYTAERQSRVVSFAEQPRPSHERRSIASNGRPSQDIRRTVTSRAFHDGFIPPVPTRQDSANSVIFSSSGASDTDITDNSSDAVPSRAMSPTQTQGAFTLTAEDIRARLQSNSPAPRPSVDEMMPALSMMRQGGSGVYAEENLLPSSPASPSPSYTPALTAPAPAYTAGGAIDRSPIMGVMPMQPLPTAAVMSPDDLLRAYASKRATGTPSGMTMATPTTSQNGGMRVLYAPPTPTLSSANSVASGNTSNPFRTATTSEYSRYSTDETPYGGVSGGNGGHGY